MHKYLKLARLTLLAGGVLVAGSSALAGIVTLKSGSVDSLAQETQVNVEYVYDGMRVGKLTEPEYLDKKTAEYNQKEAGRGDKWRVSWVEDRTKRFQPKFEELINKQFSDRKKGVTFGTFKDAKYTLILKTISADPGWNAAVMRQPAMLDAEAVLVETKNPANPIAVFTIIKSPGRDAMGYDFDTGYRLQEAYAKAGKELGAALAKKLK